MLLVWGVYFTVFMSFFQRLGVLHIGPLTSNQLLIISLLALAIPYRLLREPYFYRFAALDLALVIFDVYMWISNFMISPDPSWGIRTATEYLRNMTRYFLVVFLISDEKKMKWFIFTYIFCSVGMVLTANIINALHSGIYFSLEGRKGLSGLAGHYINYGMDALISIPLAYFMQKNYRSIFYKFILWTAIVLLNIGVLFSGSRGATISFIFMSIIILLIELRNSAKQKDIRENTSKHIKIFMLICIILFYLFWIKGGKTLLKSILFLFTDQRQVDYSLKGRSYLDIANFKLFWNNPLFGVGIDATRHILGSPTHNQWLQILAELGIIGEILAFIITFILYYYYKSTRTKLLISNEEFLKNILDGVGTSVLVLLIWALYENVGYIQPPKLFFMLLASIRMIRTIVDEKRYLYIDKSNKTYTNTN